jgi:hypothetical protein
LHIGAGGHECRRVVDGLSTAGGPTRSIPTWATSRRRAPTSPETTGPDHGRASYWAYCLADKTFFETPDRTDDTGARYAVADSPTGLPETPRLQLDARHEGDGARLSCDVEKAPHFSNAGGVHLARDQSGPKVVLREARSALAMLAGLDCVPRMLDHLVVHGHHFIIEEHVEDLTLLQAVQSRSPMVRPAPLLVRPDWPTDARVLPHVNGPGRSNRRRPAARHR